MAITKPSQEKGDPSLVSNQIKQAKVILQIGMDPSLAKVILKIGMDPSPAKVVNMGQSPTKIMTVAQNQTNSLTNREKDMGTAMITRNGMAGIVL
jgi:hypothetical protein